MPTTHGAIWLFVPDPFLNPQFGPGALGERKIRNYQAEQPDAGAWRLILLAAGR